MINTPMAELEAENFNFANSGKKAQTIPMHRIWENRNIKILAISRSRNSCFHPDGTFPLVIYFSERVGGNKNWHKNSFIICNSCLWCASCLIGLENTASCPSCNKSSLSRMKIVSNNVNPSKEELSSLNLMKGF